MTTMTLDAAFLLNPTVSLPRNTLAPFVDMGALQPFTRDVRAVSLKPYAGGAKFLDGDVLMARITPSLENGKTAIYRAAQGEPGPAFGSTEFIVIRGRKGLSDSRFAYYLVTSPEVRERAIATMNGSSGRQRVQHDAFASFLIDLPSVEEQCAIADTLGALDEKIESNRQITTKLLELGRALFEGALASGKRQVAVAEVSVFHNRRRVPLSSRERDSRRGSIPYYGATGIFGYVDDYLFDEILVLVGEDGSVVRADGGPVLQYIWGKSWINNHAHPLTGHGITNELLYLALDRSDIRPLVTGAVQAKVSMGNLRSFEIELPTEHEQTRLESSLSALFSVLRSKFDENRHLEYLRDTLLPELLSGRIRVPDALEAVQEVNS